jgi:hypothetical protein
MRTRHAQLPIRAGLLALLMGLFAVANPAAARGLAADAARANFATFTVTSTASGLSLPSRLQAGLYRVAFVNHTSGPDEVTVARYRGNKTMTDLMTAIASNDFNKINAVVTFEGGNNQIAPNATQIAYLRLTAGRYVAADMTTNKMRDFTVVSPYNGYQSVISVGTVSLYNHNTTFSILLPRAISSDDAQILRVTNIGTQVHEFALLRLNANTKQQDVINCFKSAGCTGEGLVTPAGGLGAISPGVTQWLAVKLSAGRYVAVCFMPDPSSGKSHAQLGMYSFFSVAADGDRD